MRLMEILSPETITIPLHAKEKKEIIEQLVKTLDKAGKINDGDKVLKAVLDREAVMSTGIGDGVAIPHAKSDAAPTIVAALGITAEPVDFEAMDRKPVRIVWLLVGPSGMTGPHLKALSRISRLMHKPAFRDQLIAAQSPSQVLHDIASEEAVYLDK